MNRVLSLGRTLYYSMIKRSAIAASCYAVIFSLLLVASVGAVSALAADTSQPTVKNLIYIIGDGMGFAQLDSARVVKGAPLSVDSMPVKHQAATASASHAVTDSAAGATAHATGVRTNNGWVGIAPDGRKLMSILRLAQLAGKATGVAVDDNIYAATPGGYIANVTNRNSESLILEQALFETQPDVMLGGGMTLFNNINGPARLSQTPYHLIQTREELLNWDVTSGRSLLGLFAPGWIPYAMDHTGAEPKLAELVDVAIKILSQNENGFFLMVEASHIDHTNHNNDLRRSLHEVMALDEAVAVALAFASQRDDTVVVVSADHETGGLTPGAGAPSAILMQSSITPIATQIKAAIAQDPQADVAALFKTYAGLDDIKTYAHPGSLNDLVLGVLRMHSYYYTTEGHTDRPVPVYAYGPQSEWFAEAQHTTDLGITAMEILGLKMEGR